jgi:hypothetical protein
MDKKREKELFRTIDDAFVALARLHEANHISAVYMDGTVYISDYTDIKNPKFDYYRRKDK